MIATCPTCGTVLTHRLGGLCPKCVGRVSVFAGASENKTTPFLVESSGWPPVGDYELLEQIAEGGMGIVFKARQKSLNRLVAVKLMRFGQFASAADLKRFHSEAEAVATLDHPNIAPIFEVGSTDGRAFFSMKLMSGGSLADRLSHGQEALSQKEAVELLIKVARAVHHAHQRGILHRDLKPANILLDEAGEPHVTDFGLAKFTDSASTAMTLSGSVLGTPGYMAPEQAAGHANSVTTAGDIFSLGAIFYHLLTGQAPFKGETQLETMRKVIDEEPNLPSTIARGVDRDLETICLKCLEKDPQRRYASALGFAEDLERWLRGEPIRARPSTPVEHVLKWARRKPGIAALSAIASTLLIVGIAGIAWQWRRAEGHAKDAVKALQQSRDALWQANLDRAHALRISGQIGQRVKALEAIRAAVAVRATPELRDEAAAALALPDLEDEGIWRNIPTNTAALGVDSIFRHFVSIDPGGFTVCRFTDGKPVCDVKVTSGRLENVGLSPEGDCVGFRAGPTLRVLEVATTNLLLTVSNVLSYAFAPDGRTIACLLTNHSVQLHSFSNALPARARHHPRGQGSFAFSPAGDRFTVGIADELQIWTTSPLKKIQQLKGSEGWLSVNWRGDGLGVVASNWGRRLLLWQPDLNAVDTYPEQPREGLYVLYHPTADLFTSLGFDDMVRFWSPGSHQPMLQSALGVPLGFSEDGERLAVRRGKQIGVFRVHPSRECLLVTRPGGGRLVSRAVSFSPNGLLALAAEDGVWFRDMRSGEPAYKGGDSANMLAFVNDHELVAGRWSAHLNRYTLAKDADGRWRMEKREKIPPGREGVGLFAIGQTNGQCVAFFRDQGVIWDLREEKQRLAFRGSWSPSGGSYSRNGEWIATGYWNNQYSGGSQAHLFSAGDGSVLRRFVCGNSNTSFSPDNEWLFISTPQEHRQISTKTWDVEHIYPIEGKTIVPAHMAFREDGLRAALDSANLGIQVINLKTGETLLKLTLPPPATSGLLAWSHDGRWLAHASDQKTIIWDFEALQKSLRELGLGLPD